MSDRRKFIPPQPPPPQIDLDLVTEGTRRAIFEAISRSHFTPAPGEVLAAQRAGEWYQKYSADECGLTVLYLLGRWIAYYRIWEVEDDAPESHEWEVLRVHANPSMPFGIELYEV
jgi:hypothetical protein